MIEIIRHQDKQHLQTKLRRIAERNVVFDAELTDVVAGIVEDVRRRGDAALIEYTARFDGVTLQQKDLRMDEDSLRSSAAKVEPKVLNAIREAIRRVRAFHECERQQSWEIQTEYGSRLGQRINPIDRAGMYVPGGTASYPSSVVMNVIPAQVAGVARIVVTTPPLALASCPAVAAALVELEITEVYAVGGAQAIGALAFGTETVPRVDKIAGPGNRYVTAAKKLVFGKVGIDLIAGPSEVVVIADETARPDFIVADLLAQAEHDEDAAAVLFTTSALLAESVAQDLANEVKKLPRRLIMERSLAAYGAIIIVENMGQACDLVNDLAPEHLEIIARDEEWIASRVRHAGAIFLGGDTPVALGDYLAGPNHVLPTGGAARFASPLGVYDFQKRSSILKYSADEFRRAAQLIATLAAAEGLDAHARSAMIRLELEN